ncbi:hypothetical protein DOTSEDRAFT_78098 [Dothistroma septosporum NZE10]|uniref:Uncharacterized protein n=1 Tax=Dothistroma septosporum (strain NZE10 / CBS 128990) TaxID=675120 RepID=N1PY86_DOTSN|nr:hypothetical protein DOTSEDRAFT_78098 [Dothistroma septosporum NZE10]
MAPQKREQSPAAPRSAKKRRSNTVTTINASAAAPSSADSALSPPTPAMTPAAAPAASSSTPSNVILGAESDAVIRTFGNLLEGSQCKSTASSLQPSRAALHFLRHHVLLADFTLPCCRFQVPSLIVAARLAENDSALRIVLEHRYAIRRQLANMAVRPEGFEFLHHVYGREPQTVILVSPPHLVAILAADGSWRRVPRVEAVHGPPAHTTRWYTQYLRDNNLPSWFLSGSHIQMLTLPQEADDLGIAHNPETPIASEKYLEVRYPEPPQIPLAASHSNEPFVYQLSKSEQVRLARLHPATNLLGNDRRVIVYPSGRINIHHDPASLRLPEMSPELVAWVAATAESASYYTEPQDSNDQSLAGGPPPQNDAQRLEAIEQARQHRIALNLRGPSLFNGEFNYLTDIDRQHAEILGYANPDHAASLIAHGALSLGVLPGTAPVFVGWTPIFGNGTFESGSAQNRNLKTVQTHDLQTGYLDPPVQPYGSGQWQYLSPESRDLARLNFGDQDWAGAHLAGNHHPTAVDIMLAREIHHRLVLAGSKAEDPTATVDIVWVPSITNANNDPVIVVSDDEFEEHDAPADRVEQDRGFGIDPVSGLAHWPPNDGTPNHNQTARDGRGQYQTRMVGKKNHIQKITLDVARARPTVDHNGQPNGNESQPHRTYIYYKGGRWERWSNSLLLDVPDGWADVRLVEKLNRWMEQTRIRQGWRPKRGDARERYTGEQKDWVNEQRKNKAVSYKQIAEMFNKHFGLAGNLRRDESGINSLVGRLKNDEATWAAGIKKGAGKKGKTATDNSKNAEGGQDGKDCDGEIAAETEQSRDGDEQQEAEQATKFSTVGLANSMFNFMPSPAPPSRPPETLSSELSVLLTADPQLAKRTPVQLYLEADARIEIAYGEEWREQDVVNQSFEAGIEDPWDGVMLRHDDTGQEGAVDRVKAYYGQRCGKARAEYHHKDQRGEEVVLKPSPGGKLGVRVCKARLENDETREEARVEVGAAIEDRHGGFGKDAVEG